MVADAGNAGGIEGYMQVVGRVVLDSHQDGKWDNQQGLVELGMLAVHLAQDSLYIYIHI